VDAQSIPVADEAHSADGSRAASTTDDRVALLNRCGQQVTAALGPRFRHMTLAELETAALRAITTNQFMLMRDAIRTRGETEPSTGNLTVPVGLALWASVSGEVSVKLERQKFDGAAYRLAPSEWRSGEIIWLLALVGPSKVQPAIRKQLDDEVFMGRPLQVGTLAEALAM
jgi:hemolysin-activating ACP:hemolysin acyltransferase